MSKPARKKPGKPRMKRGTRVTDRERVCMYVTAGEAKIIRLGADIYGVSVSKYMRKIVLGKY